MQRYKGFWTILYNIKMFYGYKKTLYNLIGTFVIGNSSLKIEEVYFSYKSVEIHNQHEKLNKVLKLNNLFSEFLNELIWDPFPASASYYIHKVNLDPSQWFHCKQSHIIGLLCRGESRSFSEVLL